MSKLVKKKSAAAPKALHGTPGRFASLAALKVWIDASRRLPKRWESAGWQQRNQLQAVDLARLGLLVDEASMRAALRYPVSVTPYFLSLVKWDDPLDPIRKQWVPDGREMMRLFSDAQEDPFQESTRSPFPGLVHRFPDRVLLMISKDCATRCRHCTRKNRLDDAVVLPPLAGVIAGVARYIKALPEVREVILSGGDPLLLSDAQLLRWVRALASIPQIDAVRIGTRVPCVMPMRVTQSLARGLGRSGKVWVNTQFNHVREITAASAAACARLVEAGIPVSNQSVLLEGVNDSVETMAELCRGLQRIRVRPYYVFVCDPVTGTLHFRTTFEKARRIERALARKIGGLLLPRFVIDNPQAPAKTPV
jgi:lysine 2,3-aminomutase